MNNTTTYNSNQYRPNTIYKKTLFNNHIAKNRINSPIYQPFTHKARSLKAQSLLEAILALLQYEASKVGLAQEAKALSNSILGQVNTPQRK